MSLEKLKKWIKSASPRSRFCYYEGFLLLDRAQPDAKVDKIARTAWSAAEKGSIDLTQEKVAPGKYRYWATKRKKRNRK